MMKLDVDPAELKAANFVAQAVEIVAVRLVDARFENRLPPVVDAGTLINYRTEWGVDPYETPQKGLLVTRVWLKLGFTTGAAPGKEPGQGHKEAPTTQVAEMVLKFELQYTIPSEPLPEEIEKIGGLAPFAKWNGLYNCWPYFRQEVSRMCVAAGLPPIQLPLVKLVPGQVAPTNQ